MSSSTHLRLTHLSSSSYTQYKCFYLLATQEGFSGVAMVTLEHLSASVFADWEHSRDVSLAVH